jgi:hypothetical protein
MVTKQSPRPSVLSLNKTSHMSRAHGNILKSTTAFLTLKDLSHTFEVSFLNCQHYFKDFSCKL